MVLTVQSALSQIEHSLGGSLSSELDAIGILNEAGQYMAAMHDWMWLDRPPAGLDFRAEVVLSGSATISNGGAHLVKSNAFANYTHLVGDTIVVEGGSVGATALPKGRFQIREKVDNDTIHIEWGHTTNGAVTGLSATVKADSIALPNDFANAIDIQPTEGLVNSFNFCDTAMINQLRTNEVAVGNYRYWGAITRGQTLMNGAVSGNGKWRIEIYPSPASNQANALTMFYRAGWIDIEDDTVVIPIPDFCNTLYRAIIRAFARGYEEDDVASIHQRLLEIEQSPVFVHAKRRDGDMQPTLGQMQGGAFMQQRKNIDEYLKTTVIGPQ